MIKTLNRLAIEENFLNITKSSPCSPKPEEAQAQQRRPNAAKN